MSEVRKYFDGPVILAGGISNGRSLAAARVLGADMVAAGTRFIAATESAAPDAYREILIESGGDDIVLTSQSTDRKSLGSGKSVSLRVDLVVRRIIKPKNENLSKKNVI